MNEDLRKWFGKGEKGGIGGGGWDRYNTKGERIGKCAREPGEPKPKCLSKEKAAKMSKDEIAAAVKRKREKDPVADRPGKGGTPKMVSNKIDEGLFGRKKVKPGTTNVTYGGMTQDQIRAQNKQKKANIKTKSDVNKGSYDDPWLRSAPHGEKKHHYRQLRGEEVESDIRYCPMCKKKEKRSECSYGPEMWDVVTVKPLSEKKDPCWKGYKQVGMKDKNGKKVPNCVKVDEEYIEEKNVPTNPSLWSKMKSKAKAKFDVYPSAYANGWAAKEYKKAGGKWKSVSEEIEIQDAYGETFAVVDDIIKADSIVCERCGQNPCICDQLMGYNEVNEAVRIPSKTGNIINVSLLWRGKYFFMKIFFPQVRTPSRKEVQDQISKVYPGSRVISYNASDIKPGEQFLQVESKIEEPKERLKTDRDMFNIPSDEKMSARERLLAKARQKRKEKGLEEDWQKVNKKDKTDGMSQKAVNAYRRENPGSKLKTAVTEKDPGPERSKRRKSFCARSKGQMDMHNVDCSKTPDKPICKARRRWRC